MWATEHSIETSAAPEEMSRAPEHWGTAHHVPRLAAGEREPETPRGLAVLAVQMACADEAPSARPETEREPAKRAAAPIYAEA
jgi:hypothetical protein